MSPRSLDAPALGAAPARTDPLAALRQATQERHARLDAQLPIARPDARLHDYTCHARALSAWLAALAPELRAIEAATPDFRFDEPARLAALHADLLDAGAIAAQSAVPPGAATQAAIAQALQEHAALPMACRWGIAYVVEGSQLGGQVLFRRLAERLAPHPLRYLQGRGSEGTAARWRAFIEQLRGRLASPADVQAACAGACAAFDGMAHELRAAGAPL
ncbi:biliverdin-producing heme oxygenase [Paracidovorax wautersii]|uniref:Heme oxygenase n=1 Tax=Paracidovorax wautersii TaxID=1177982 RepID=A0A1I2GEB0_9BURK|nr:biliverdin-producing heme oxygenase [Paracidovorax wautersii]SFF15533.1 Heme oxygenase [Paracidovorax wautersii]